MTETLRPTTADEVRDIVAEAVAHSTVLEVRGGGSKRDIGAPHRPATVLDTSGLDQVIDYDPPELVLTVGAGMKLAAVEALVAGRQQMLAFEPFDHGPLFGRPAGEATIGGVIAAGVSGSRRVSAGAGRDHLLGFEAVSGRGEAFVGGARVVKNVTGYDLPKVMAGSWGRLAVLTTVTLKVLPRPPAERTLVLRGLDDRRAVTAMARAMGSQASVAAAANLPDHAGGGLTALRLEGHDASLGHRLASLTLALDGFGPTEILEPEAAEALWRSVRYAEPLADADILWRVNTPPSQGPSVFEALAGRGARRLYDWAGGLVWLGLGPEVEPAAVRAAAAAAGGHAILVRAPESVRAATSALHPEPAAVERLQARVKAAFDPHGILDPDRFKV